MRELIVVRHGESEGNVLGLAQGRSSYPLTERGRAQARGVGELFRREGWSPTLLVTSPVLRCVATAEILRAELDLPEPLLDEAFTEIDPGRAIGRPMQDIRDEHPEFFDRPATEWLGWEPLGGESDREVLARVAAGLDALPAGERIALVTHGAVFKGVLHHLLGLTTRFFLELRCGSCLRIAHVDVGPVPVPAFTHFLHIDSR